MTLTNRLTLFSLVALAVVLTAFSVTLYVLARSHLYAELDGRVSTTMDTLVALAEIEPDGLDWEPELRRLPAHWEGDPPVWAIYDETGSRVDGSHVPGHRLTDYAAPGSVASRERFRAEWDGSDWEVARQTLVFATPETIRSRPGRERHQTLVFVTAWPVAPVQGVLRTLAWSLAGVSVGVWLLSGLVGRWVCRRALSPVSRMTEVARRITTADQGDRLPVPPARDELHDLAAAFNELLTRLQDSFERQRRFTGDASHQLRTPLTAMLGQMEVALRREREPGEYRRVLTTAVAQAGRLRDIVESLLFLARADADAQLPDLEVMELVDWLPRHVAEVWSAHPRRGDLMLELPESFTLPVLAHPTLVGQAIDNLIDNAFKYSPAGSPVRVTLRCASGQAVIAVRDEGPGIAAGDTTRIFDPFFRTDDARKRGVGGLGLGLGVADRITRALGGEIELRSEDNNGCLFTLLLPLSADPPDAINAHGTLVRSVGA